MLLKLCVLISLFAQALSQSRYFVGIFQSSYQWAYPIDVCALPGVLGSVYVKYTCSGDGLTVTQTKHSGDNTCSNTPTSTTLYTASNETADGLYAFNCDGTDDYMQAKLLVGSCTSPTVTAIAYSAINGCFKFIDTNMTHDVYQQSQCNSTNGIIATYNSTVESCDTMSSSTILNSQTILSTSCTEFGKSGAFTIYSTLLDCVYNDISNFPQTQDNSGDLSDTGDGNLSISFTITASTDDTSSVDAQVCTIDWNSYFTSYFTDCLVSTTSTCNSYEGIGYPTDTIAVDVTVYENSNPTSEDCDTIKTAFDSYVTTLGNVDATLSDCTTAIIVPPTTTEPKSSAYEKMYFLNYLIVFAISCFIMM